VPPLSAKERVTNVVDDALAWPACTVYQIAHYGAVKTAWDCLLRAGRRGDRWR